MKAQSVRDQANFEQIRGLNLQAWHTYAGATVIISFLVHIMCSTMFPIRLCARFGLFSSAHCEDPLWAVASHKNGPEAWGISPKTSLKTRPMMGWETLNKVC